MNEMPLIGIFRRSGQPGSVALAIAHVARMKNARAVFFTLQDVDLERRRIRGLTYEPDGWARSETPFPDVLENEDSVQNSGEAWTALTAQAPFTTRKLGGKIEVMRRMAASGFYPELQIPTETVADLPQVSDFIARHGRIVLKPVYSNGGRNIIFVTRSDDGFLLDIGKGQRFTSPAGFEKFYREVVATRAHVMQRHISSVTKLGAPFDMRLHVRRDGNGHWRTVIIYGRVGDSSTVASNIRLGGSFAPSAAFLNAQYGNEGPKILAHLTRLAEEMPEEFQKLYPEGPLDALGFDIGLDQSGKPWIFEVNCYPSSAMFALEDAILRVDYALHLARVSRPA